MNSKELKTYGMMMFGRDWQLGLSRIMRVHRRTVRGWYEGRSPVPSGTDTVIVKEMARVEKRINHARMKLLKKLSNKKYKPPS